MKGGVQTWDLVKHQQLQMYYNDKYQLYYRQIL